MPQLSQSGFWLVATVLLTVAFIPSASAFGAGNVPSYSYLEDKAFRHGDIEDTIEKLSKVAGSSFLGLGAKKFGGLDVKRIYFGNWLRDFSQAMDTATLTKVSKQSIINVVMVLGFLTHGYATGEFEVNDERLGVYLPIEHIDNPKGYNDDKDARSVDPRLRPPVQREELNIDPRTGLKNYIANEGGNWDTSTKFIRRILHECIQLGRQGLKSSKSSQKLEAYRLLGTALHTLEDLPAHSNFCELALLRMGHREVFCHVGDNVLIQSPGGRCPPLVTGTFGGEDFLHSMLGEASDHLSQASVSDLQLKCKEARESQPRGGDGLQNLLSKLPDSDADSISRDVEQVSRDVDSRDPERMSPQEMYATLWKVLSLRDKISMSIEKTIEKIPGLNALVEKISEEINRWVFLTIEPYVKPLMVTATQAFSQGSELVIRQGDQFQVFDDPDASDPTHSMLSKDHFDDLLNEPAGNLAIIIVRHSVKHVVKAWHDKKVDINQTIDKILEAIHHPYFADTSSPVQSDMAKYMQQWYQETDQEYALKHLTKDAVRRGDNKREGTSAKPSNQGQYQSFLPPPNEFLNNLKDGLLNSGDSQSGPQKNVASGEAQEFYGSPSGNSSSHHVPTHEQRPDSRYLHHPQQYQAASVHEQRPDSRYSHHPQQYQAASVHEQRPDSRYSHHTQHYQPAPVHEYNEHHGFGASHHQPPQHAYSHQKAAPVHEYNEQHFGSRHIDHDRIGMDLPSMPDPHGMSGRHGMPEPYGMSGHHGIPEPHGMSGRHGIPEPHGMSGRHGMPDPHGMSGRHGMPDPHGMSGHRGMPDPHGMSGHRGSPEPHGMSGHRGSPEPHGVSGHHGIPEAHGMPEPQPAYGHSHHGRTARPRSGEYGSPMHFPEPFGGQQQPPHGHSPGGNYYGRPGY